MNLAHELAVAGSNTQILRNSFDHRNLADHEIGKPAPRVHAHFAQRVVAQNRAAHAHETAHVQHTDKWHPSARFANNVPMTDPDYQYETTGSRFNPAAARKNPLEF
jgi:hypothetical protein